MELASFDDDAEVGRLQVEEFVVSLFGEPENSRPFRLDFVACFAKAASLVLAIATLGVSCHLRSLRLLVPLGALLSLLRALHVDL